VSADFCESFVGYEDAVNFSVTSFYGHCMGTTSSCLAGIVVGFLWFRVEYSVTCFSGLPDMNFSLLNCWGDGSIGEVGGF
jgi:hypothetical protein